MATDVLYKGVLVTIDQLDDERAEIIIDGHVFRCAQVPGELSMWHCDQAWYAPDTLEALGRHIVNYWHIITDPTRLPPDPLAQHGGHGGPEPRAEGGAHGHGAAAEPPEVEAAERPRRANVQRGSKREDKGGAK